MICLNKFPINIIITKRKHSSSPRPRKRRKRPQKPEVQQVQQQSLQPIPLLGFKPEWVGQEPPHPVETISDLVKFAFTYKGSHVNIAALKAVVPILLELEEMIGLEKVKRSILDLIMHFLQNKHQKNKDYLHMVVCGPPGCGKTTFCRILGKILSKLGILPNDTFTIVKRTDFVAKYLGQTAHRTEEILNKCKGGVMFIDEAYSLSGRRGSGSEDTFAKEAIDFLNQFLSEHKDDLCCIIAGYEEELESTIFSMNEGLKRRFPWKFVIEAYTEVEMHQIFLKMLVENNYKITEGVLEPVFFKENAQYFKYAGGDIETFITKCKFIHTRNTFGKIPDNILTAEDIKQALREHIHHKSVKKNDTPIGMYI